MFGCFSKSLWSILVFLVTLASAQPTQALRNVKVGDQVPPFSVKSLDGKTIVKTDYKEKVLLLIFVRPEQEHSLKALKVAQRIVNDNINTELAVLAVSSKPKAGEYFKQLVIEHGLTLPIALDPERKMFGAYGLIVSPTTLLIDGAGVLRFGLPHMPPNYERKLRIHVDLLLDRIKQEEHDALLAQASETRYKEQDSFERNMAFAQTLIDQRKFDLALPVLAKLKSENEDSVPVKTLLGTLYLELDNLDEAAKCLDPLVNLKPSPASLKLAFARLETRRGNDDKAEAYFIDALKASQQKGRILYELGCLYQRKGDGDKAIKCYRDALEEIFGKVR